MGKIILTNEDRKVLDEYFEDVLRLVEHPDLIIRLVALGQFELLVQIANRAGFESKFKDMKQYRKALFEVPTLRHIYNVQLVKSD